MNRHLLSLAGVLLAANLVGCASGNVDITAPAPPPASAVSAATPEAAPAPISVEDLPAKLLGYSGMARLDSATYVVVHDTKAHKDGPRLGLLRIAEGVAPEYQPVAVADWGHPEGRASDLESACALPGRPGEILAAESSSWKGKYGRIFHLRINGAAAEVLGVHALPLSIDSGPDQRGENFEGLACAAREGGETLVVLGERGGSALFPNGSLRWGYLGADAGALRWPEAGRAGIEVAAPGAWHDAASNRDVAALHFDAEGTLWATGAEDAGDGGPFRSVIYAIAELTSDAESPLRKTLAPRVGWSLDGLKVESLAAAPEGAEGTRFAVGTEDEDMGGVWRPLFPSLSP